ALDRGSNTSASLSIRRRKSFWSSSHFFFNSHISSSTSAYFFLPTVRLPTIFPRAIPTAPTRADAPPPPGTGALEARTSTNSLHGTVENPISCILLKSENYCCKNPEKSPIQNDQNRPEIFPVSSTSILSAAGTFGRPGIVMISPVSATTKPAPAEIFRFLTVTSKSV